MKRPVNLWIPFGFAAVLSMISLAGIAIGAGVADGAPHAGLIPLIAFLPMAFYFSAAGHRQTRDHVAELEERVRQLESAAGHSEGA